MSMPDTCCTPLMCVGVWKSFYPHVTKLSYAPLAASESLFSTKWWLGHHR